MTSFLCSFEEYLHLKQAITTFEVQLAQSAKHDDLLKSIAALEVKSAHLERESQLRERITNLETQLAQSQKETEHFKMH